MRFPSGVDVPEPLLDALQSGRLVVFAGAGISKGSGLPDFRELLDAIAVRSGVEHEPPPDEWLGKLKRSGRDVHTMVEEELDLDGIDPSATHDALAAMFRRRSEVRIVTTNHDLLLEDALRTEWSEELPAHAYPDLPNGREFSGVVHLHGQIAGRLVLTDLDFAEAYLSDRDVAARFLREMFGAFTTLFVGYSHQDVLPSYLATHLAERPETRPRYVLLDADDGATRERFEERFGIQIIPYENTADHQALVDTLLQVGQHVRLGAAGHARRMKELVGATPESVTPDELDFIRVSLRHKEYYRFFYRFAGGEWLSWLHAEGVLDSLFDLAGSEAPRELIAWFAEHVTTDFEHEGLEIVGTDPRPLGASAAHAVAWALWCRRRDGQSSASATARWLAVLCQSPRIGVLHESLTHILTSGEVDEDADWMCPLLGLLTEPVPVLREEFLREDDAPPRPFRAEIDVRGDDYWFKEWVKKVQPEIGKIANRILPMLRANLELAHDLLLSLEEARPSWDPRNFRRSEIARVQGEDSRLRDGFDALIDLARDSVEWLVNYEAREMSQAVLTSWSMSEAPLCVRIALYGLARHSGFSPAAKLRLVEEREWLARSQIKPELFRLIESAYPKASQSARVRFLRTASRATIGRRRIGRSLARDAREDDDLKFAVFRYLDLLSWLNGATACPLVKDRLAAFRTHFPNFRASKDPHLNFSEARGGFVSTESPLGTKEILDLGVAGLLVEIEKARESSALWDDEPNDDEQGLLSGIREATAADVPWSIRIATELVEANIPACQIWHSLIDGWANASLDRDVWKAIVKLLTANSELLDEWRNGACRLLNDALERAKEGSLTAVECVEIGASLAHGQWLILKAKPSDREYIHDRFTTALNDPVGKLARFAIVAQGYLCEEYGSHWHGRSPLLSELVTDLARPRQGTEGSIVMLGWFVDYLLARDSDWTLTHVLPLFDFETNPEAAPHAWGGRLAGRPLSPAGWQAFRPHWIRAYTHVEAIGDEAKRFAEHTAMYAVFHEARPLDDLELRRFLSVNSETADRVQFATTIAGILTDSSTESNDALWGRWLGNYVRERTLGNPALREQEWASMVNWPLYLDTEFANAFDLIIRRTTLNLENDFVFHELDTVSRRLVDRDSERVARYLEYLLKGIRREAMYEWESVDKLRSILANAGVSSDLLRAIDDRCAELGHVVDENDE